MEKKEVLTINWSPNPTHTADHFPQRVFVSLNSIIFMMNLLERKYQELESILVAYHQSRRHEANTNGQHKIYITWGYEKGDLLIDLAWGIIDWCEKLRKVSSSVAGIKKKEGWYKDLVKSFEMVKSIRNFMQHYDRELDNFIKDSTPLMGVVSAQFPLGSGQITYVISSSTFKSQYKDKINIYGLEFSNQTNGSIDFITFSIAKHSLNISVLMRNFRNGLEGMKSYMSKTYDYDWPESVAMVHNISK